ncbi:unnamed protein product [Echinostoma caproni]|uniref:SERPIN domain-containing protein n=1 Tax=Echinostoma caproni TaxID=27848 RepID=A0A183AY80_9TREM|nr:unnamed protein product [Echinostoma caproni]
MASVCQALKDFSDKLYAKVVESQGGNYHNVFVSPVSIYAAMSMVLAGSQGETKREMLSALQLAAGMSQETHHNSIGTTIRSCFESTPGVTVSVGNRLFAEQNAPINAEYKSLLLKDYQADTENVDFLADAESARKRINKWVSEQTKEKIQELFPPGSLRSDSCVAITNALYFKGSWEIAFPKEVTGQHDFYLLNGTKKKMKMMYKEDDFKSTVDEEGATAAAATGAIATFCCIMPSMQVRVVHPFFVALVYDDKIPIFMGHVLDPEEN